MQKNAHVFSLNLWSFCMTFHVFFPNMLGLATPSEFFRKFPVACGEWTFREKAVINLVLRSLGLQIPSKKVPAGVFLGG